MKTNIKYSPWKMWYIASFVRGMSVDAALKQLKFVLKSGARDVAETIEEARRMAIAEHNVEYGTNLWVAESFVGKGLVVKGKLFTFFLLVLQITDFRRSETRKRTERKSRIFLLSLFCKIRRRNTSRALLYRSKTTA